MGQVGWSVSPQPTGEYVLQFSTPENGLEYTIVLAREDFLLFVRSLLGPLLTQPDLALGLLGITAEVFHAAQ